MFGNGSFMSQPFEDMTDQFAAVTIIVTSSISGVPTSDHKQLLVEPVRQLIYAAEISPWTLS